MCGSHSLPAGTLSKWLWFHLYSAGLKDAAGKLQTGELEVEGVLEVQRDHVVTVLPMAGSSNDAEWSSFWKSLAEGAAAGRSWGWGVGFGDRRTSVVVTLSQ